MATDEFKHESLQDAQSVSKYLRALIEGLESGYLEFGNDDGEMELHPRGLLGMELRAKCKGGQAKVQLKLAWREVPKKTLGQLKLKGQQSPSQS